MSKRKISVTAQNPFELAQVLGLSKADAIAMDFRARLNKKIIDLVRTKGLTHDEVAKSAKASRTRVTAILNGQTLGVSTDFLLRLLYALGCKTTPVFRLLKKAA